MSEKKPKKRGRKPKSNITINNNPVFDSNQKMNNLIVCLKTKKTDEISSGTELPGYVKNDEYEIKDNEYNDDIICWNCCHNFNCSEKKEIPIKYDNNVFHVYGVFCSFECGARYILDNYSGSELWEKISLLNIYYNVSTKNYKKVKYAPPKLYLKKFGGNLSIDEYRKDSSYNDCVVNLPAIIPVYNTYHKFEAKIKQNENKDYNLYRKNPVKNDNNILESMKIKN